MKNMRISATEKVIEIEYKTVQKASDIYYKMDKWEQERCCLNGRDLTYDLTEVKFKNIVLIVRNLIKKSCDAKFDTNLIDKGTVIDTVFDVMIEEGKLFKITLIRKDGVIGKFGFGCWQYGRILSINDFENSFKLRIRNSNIEDCVPEIVFTEDITLLIEIGEIQF